MFYWENFYKPQGLLGKIILLRMNFQHKGKIKWIMSFVDIKNIHTALDIGCGGGGFINYFIKSYPEIKIYGLDHSNVSVKAALRLNKKYIPLKCEIIEGNVSNIPFADESIDLVTSFSSIYYWFHLQEDLKEIYRVLTHSGILVLDCTLFEFKNTDIGKSYEKKIPNFKLYEFEYMFEVIKNIGFKNAQIYRKEHPLRICIVANKQ